MFMKKILVTISLLCVATLSFAQIKTDDAEYNQYGQKVESTPVEAKLQDGILVFQAKQKDYKLWFDVRVQADGAFFFGAPDFCSKTVDGKENANHIGNGMNIRRARFAVKADLGKGWYGEIDTDFTSGTFEIKDAIVSYNPLSNLELKVGNFKENFSIDRNTTSRYLMFMERPMVTALAPSRHLGFGVTYFKNWFWISGGAFGPELKGSEEQLALEDGNKDFGRNSGMSYTGKIVFRPLFKSQISSLHIGGAVSYREPKVTSTDGYGVARYSTRNSTSINRKKYIDTDVIKGMDHEVALTGELAGHYKGFRAEAAYIARGAFLDQKINPLKTQWMQGWYAQASYLLFGGRQNYDYSGGKPTRIDPGRDWGDLELAFRYEYADFNSKNYFGGSGEAYTVGLNFYPHKNIKIVINYQYNNNDRYANGKGKLYVGYDKNGAPTKDYKAVVGGKGKAGVDYSMLAMRVQVAF